MLGELIQNITLGLGSALQPQNLLYCVIGVVLGTILGVLPGIGVLVSLTLLFPFTFHVDPAAGLIMLAGIFYGTAYGGSTASILLNVPGTPSTAVACLDGYPMAKQGRAGIALVMTAVGSFVGGSLGIILMMLFAPVIASSALAFGSAEYFALMMFGLIAASTISLGSPIKGIAMVLMGLLLATVGTDISGEQRFIFDFPELFSGISLVALAMGLFGATEVIFSARAVDSQGLDPKSITFRSMIPTRDDWRRSWMPIIRGSSIGSFVGILPGVGALIASFMAYSVEKRLADDPSRFGKGAIEGVAAPEAANNAADQTAFIPTMTLGIPGSAAMAIMIGVLIVHGITPGPLLVSKHPDLFWGLVMSFWIGNVLLVVLNVPFVGLWVRLLTIPYHLLYPAITMFICLGVYTINRSSFDVWATVAATVLGYLMRLCGFPAAPLILGFVLGPMLEEHFRRAMIMSGGNPLTFIERPISLSIVMLTVVVIGLPLLMRSRAYLRARTSG